MHRSMKICCLIVCGLVAVSDVMGQVDGLSVDKSHISSVAESHLANLEAWRKGDVLIRYSTSGEGKLIADGVGEVAGPNAISVVVREDCLSRLVFDLESERVVIINRMDRVERFFNSLNEEIQQPVRKIDNRVILYDKTTGLESMRTDAGEIRVSPISAPIMGGFGCLARMRVLDLRYLGFVEFANWNFETLKEGALFNNQVDNIEQIQHVGKNVYRVVAKDLQHVRRFSGRYLTDWDLQRNVPVRFECHHTASSNDPVQITTVDWKLMEGLFVPESARLSQRSIVEQGKREYHLREETTVDAHWFSLNRELPAELFDEKWIRDQKKLDELLDTAVFEDQPKADRNDR